MGDGLSSSDDQPGGVMIYRELPLPAAVQSVALCAWQFVMEAADPPMLSHQVPPDGTTNLVLIGLPDGSRHARLIGPSLAAATVPVAQGFTYAGLRLRPEAAEAVTGIMPRPGTSEPLELEGPFAQLWDDLAAADTSDWSRTANLAETMAVGDPSVGGAVDRLIATGGAAPVAMLAAAAALGERQFRRRFHAATGLAPKQYADVQRVRHALLRALGETDWAGIAHDSGFADQPHLARDIKERFGATPRLVAGYLGGIRHELLAGVNVRIVQDDAARAA